MLPGGWVIDQIGPRRALTGMGLGLGFFVVLTGMLGWLGLSIASLFIPLLLIRGAAGCLSAPLHPGTSRAVSLWMPLTARLSANGLLTAGALLGVAFAAPGFGWLMDRLEWPLAFALCGSLLMLFSVVWNRLSADGPGRRAEYGHSATWSDLVRMLGNRHLVLLGISFGALGYFQYLFFYWIGFYFNETLQLPTKDSRDAKFMINIAMAFGMAAGGWCAAWLCRRIGFRWGCRVIALSGMGLSGLLAWQGVVETDPNVIVLYFALAMASLGFCECVFWTTASTLEKDRGGLAAAFINTGSNLGGTIAPSLTPWIASQYNWTAAIVVASVVCGIGGILWLLIDPEPP
jgi:MFS family permease